MAAEPTSTTQPAPAPEGQAQPQAQPAPAQPAQTGTDPATLQAQVDALVKHKQALEADLKKHRDAKKELEDRAAAEKATAEAKLKEQGDFAKLYDAEKEKRTALEARVSELAPKAERLTAHEKRVAANLEAAKAKGDLPSYIVRAIDIAAARDVDEAADILAEFRASQGSSPAPSKQPAPPAPAPGGAPASPAPKKRLEEMSAAEITHLQATDPAALRALAGGATNGVKPSWNIISLLGR